MRLMHRGSVAHGLQPWLSSVTATRLELVSQVCWHLLGDRPTWFQAVSLPTGLENRIEHMGTALASAARGMGRRFSASAGSALAWRTGRRIRSRAVVYP